jgi:hypothetical protein
MQVLEEIRTQQPQTNPPPFEVTGDIRFSEAAKTVLQSHLGKRWLLSLLALAVIVFWPIAAFWRVIALEPARFTEEWIKLAAEGVLLFFLLEIMRHRSASVVARRSVGSLIAAYEQPLEQLMNSLRALKARVGEKNDAEFTSLAREASRAWSTLERGLSDEFIHRLPEGLRTTLLIHRLELKPERCTSILRSIRAAERTKQINLDELSELIGRCENLLTAFISLRSAAE